MSAFLSERVAQQWQKYYKLVHIRLKSVLGIIRCGTCGPPQPMAYGWSFERKTSTKAETGFIRFSMLQRS